MLAHHGMLQLNMQQPLALKTIDQLLKDFCSPMSVCVCVFFCLPCFVGWFLKSLARGFEF
jgi:hypothetical protein